MAKKTSTSSTSALSTVPQTIAVTAPSTTAPAPPAGVILGVTIGVVDVRIAIAAAGTGDVVGRLEILAEGLSTGRQVFPVEPTATEVVIPWLPDPDTKYTAHLIWSRNSVDGIAGERALGPRYAQPVNRGVGPVAGGGWSALRDSKDRPTRRNPCAPVHVVYDDRDQRVDLDPLLRTGLARAADAAGITIVYDGISRVAPADPRGLVVSWRKDLPSTFVAATFQTFATDTAGVVWRTTASIRFNAKRTLPTMEFWYTIVLHEVGHYLGLDHSHDPTSMMFAPVESGVPRPQIFADYNSGDLAGLRAMNGALASDGCIPADPLWPAS